MDNEEEVKSKINKAECVAGDPNNGLMAILKYFIFIIKKDRKETFRIPRPEKFGGDLSYSSYEEIEKDFIEQKLHPLDLKNGITEEINKFLKNFRTNKKLLKLYNEAYGSSK